MSMSSLAPVTVHSPALFKDLAQIARPFSDELAEVRRIIAERVFREESFADLLAATGEKARWDRLALPPWLEGILYQTPLNYESKTRAMAEHMMARGGKLLRATLILAILRALAAGERRGPKLAAAMELIHLATLLHDDVIDRADVRRGSPSLPFLYDNSPTVLMGDHLFARAFELIAECGEMEIISSSCRATSAMCRGEVEQLQWIGRPDVPQAAYFHLIEMKTAALMASCAESAAILGAGNGSRIPWYRFGLTLGMLFQMTDDLLDFIADETALGKQTGSDAAAGKYTLPLILFRERLGGPEELRSFLTRASTADVVRRSLEENGILDEVRDRLRELADTCHSCLDDLVVPNIREPLFRPLHDLVDFVLLRDH
jgi:octaprenyl-diphosphate synthase